MPPNEVGAWEEAFAEATDASGDEVADVAEETAEEATDNEVSDSYETEEEETEPEADSEVETETEEEADEEEPRTRGPGSGKRPGADEVLNYLQDNYPEARDVVRSWQQTVSRNVNEFNELKAQMLDVVNEMREMKEQKNEAVESTQEAPNENSRGRENAQEDTKKPYNQAQYDLVQSILQDAGVITKSEVEAEKELEATQSYVQESLSSGLKTYGDSFGSQDESGKVSLNEELKSAIKPVLERIESHGLTPLDLAILSGKVSAASDSSGNSSRRESNLRRANVVQRGSSSSRSTSPTIRKKGDDAEDVFDRAFALAQRELTQ